MPDKRTSDRRDFDRDRDFEKAHAALLAELDRDFEETGALTGRPAMSARVRAAMGKVPRHRFVPDYNRAYAYENRPLPIGEGQTISQPYIVALMTELAQPGPTDRVLEIGTGSGYQCAVLAAGGTRLQERALEDRRRLKGLAGARTL